MRLVKHIGENVILVALEPNERMPDSGPLTVDGIVYDVDDIFMPEEGLGSEPIFAVRFKKTPIAQGQLWKQK